MAMHPIFSQNQFVSENYAFVDRLISMRNHAV